MAKQAKLKFEVPEVPGLLPDNLKREWKRTYIEARQQAEEDGSLDLAGQVQQALREANRVLRTPKVESYSAAMQLEGWQVVRRDEVGGVLKVVTIDAKKYSFPVPASAQRTDSTTAGQSEEKK